MAVRETPASRSQADIVAKTSTSGRPAEKPRNNIPMTRGCRYIASADRQSCRELCSVVPLMRRPVLGTVSCRHWSVQYGPNQGTEAPGTLALTAGGKPPRRASIKSARGAAGRAPIWLMISAAAIPPMRPATSRPQPRV